MLVFFIICSMFGSVFLFKSFCFFGGEEEWFMLEIRERQGREELGDLIQVPLFDAALTGGLSLDQLQPWREVRIGLLKEWGIGMGQSLALLGGCLRASGCESAQWVKQRPRCCSQVQEGQSDHWSLWLASDVYCARWQRVFIKLQPIKRIRITES